MAKDQSATQAPRPFYGWAITGAAFVTLLLSVGIPFYGMPFFYDYFIHEFHWSRAETTSGIGLATILVQPLAGAFVYRFSPRMLIVAGAILLCLSMAGFACGNGTLLCYYLAWCAFMAGYICAGPLPHQIILSRWFRRNRGFAMGVAYLGLGLGGAISQKFVALPLISHFGWRIALVLIGSLILLLIPLQLFIVRDRPSEMGLFPDGDPETPRDDVSRPQRIGEVLRQRSFWLLALGSCASIGAIGSINQHMKLIFLDAGLPASTVADTTFVILVASLAGRLAMGWLADRIDKKRVMVAAFLLVALPIPLLFIVNHHAGAPFLFAAIFGFGLGADYMLIPLLAAQVFGVDSLPRVMGIILPADSIGQTCFPFLAGVLRDRFGDYRYGLVMIMVLAFAGALAIAALPGRRVTRPEVCTASSAS